jgi:four helix bundle protein
VPKAETRSVERAAIYSAPADIGGQAAEGSDEPVDWGADESSDFDLLVREEEQNAKAHSLLERTARFGAAILLFCKRVPMSPVNSPLINQLVRSGTSVGANYCEADDPLSRKDYIKSVGICRKESKEACYWLRMLATAEPTLKSEARLLWREAWELNRIFGAIYRKK